MCLASSIFRANLQCSQVKSEDLECGNSYEWIWSMKEYVSECQNIIWWLTWLESQLAMTTDRYKNTTEDQLMIDNTI